MDKTLAFNSLDSCIDGMVVTDQDGCVLFINRTTASVLNLAAETVVNGKITTLLPAVEQIRSVFLHDGEQGQEQRFLAKGIETKGRSASGCDIPLEVTLSPIDFNGKQLHLYILRDISKRREIEGQMDALQADMMHMARVSAVDEMGAALAHEINQPLTAAILYLSALTRGSSASELSEASRLLIEKAQKEAERASQIIQRMRSFIEKRTPHRAPVSLEFIMDDAIELTLLGTQRVVHVSKETDPDLPLILADAVQIEQVLVNLLRNAIEATRDLLEPKVTITAKTNGGFVRIEVNDNGKGIEPETMPNLFKAFASSKSNGLGVGLTISRSIVQNHGGELTVDPGGNSRGATFVLTVPVAPSINDPEE